MPGKGIRPAVLASALLALGPTTAAAEPPWLAPETISAPGERAEPGSLTLAVAPSGDAVAAWTTARRGGWVVRAATRSARGPWQAPRDLSGVIEPALPGTRVGVPAPRAVIGPGGDAAVAWVSGGQGALRFGSALMVAVRPGATGAWTPAEQVSAPDSAPPGVISARLAIEPSGTVLAVWQQGAVNVAAATRLAATGTWSDPLDLAGEDGPGFPPIGTLVGLATNRAGTSAVWRLGAGGGMRLATRPPGGTFSAPETIQMGLLPALVLAVGPAGEILAVRTALDQEGQPERLEAAIRPPGGPLGSYAAIGPAGSLSAQALAIDAEGDAVVAWSAPGRSLSVAERPAGGAWTAPTRIPPNGTPTAPPQVALNHAGAGIVIVPRERPHRRSDIAASLRPAPGGRFGPPERVAPFTEESDLAAPAIDDDGVAAVTYTVEGRVRSVLRARELPGEVRLTAAQLRVNQRISQAAVRRANAIDERLRAGLTGADIRPGALRAEAFATGVRVTGAETGALTPPGPGRPLVVPASAPAEPGTVRLTAAQLRINQRIAQAAVRRANRLAKLFEGGLRRAHVADGTIGPEHLAPGLAIGDASDGSAPTPPGPEPAGRSGPPGQVILSATQLRINQRVSQAAVRRLNSLVARLERGLPGSSFAPGSITAADLAPGLRR